jgi:putative transport protein
MKWLTDMHTAQGLLVLCIVAVLGLALGSIKVRGVSLGVAGALFVGIIFGEVGWNIDPEVRSFVQEFGLILFVYAIGMQVGPGFLTSLRRQGLPLNLLAAGIVLTGAGLTVGLCQLLGIDLAAGVGLFAGATTNTPALGAAQEALKEIPNLATGRASLPALGYAVCYPFGILGIILTLILVRAVGRVNSKEELTAFRTA